LNKARPNYFIKVAQLFFGRIQMKNYIYCTTTAKGEQTFYLMAQGTKYFLFVQAYRRSNKEVFEQGISLYDLRKLKKHCSYSVRHTATKLPAYIRYVEQECGISVMEMTKRKQPNWKNKKRVAGNDSFDWEVA
jgi:hypothetical protein